jgi:hypothetical protein
MRIEHRNRELDGDVAQKGHKPRAWGERRARRREVDVSKYRETEVLAVLGVVESGREREREGERERERERERES